MRWHDRAVSRLARNITGPMRNGKSGSWGALGNPGSVHSVAPPVEKSQSVWSMRTTEGSWRQRSVENVYQQSWLWEQRHRYDRWDETDGRHLWTESVSLGLHQDAREYSGGSSRGVTIRVYSRVPAKGDFGKRKRRLPIPNRWQCAWRHAKAQ